MIRSTQAKVYDLVTYTALRQQSRLATVQERALTGLLMNRPSDAPGQVSEAHRLRAAIADHERYGQHAGRAEDLLNTADTALASASDTLTQLRELAVSMSNESYTAEDRAAQVEAVQALRDTFLAAANAELGGRHVFGGTAWDTPPFDAAGAYVGNDETPTLAIGAATTIEVGASGREVFLTDIDVFQVFSDLETALTANDTAGITATLDGIDTAAAALGESRSRLGAAASAAEDGAYLSGALLESLQARYDEVVGIDAVATYTELAELQAAYETTLSVASQVNTGSLFDKL